MGVQFFVVFVLSIAFLSMGVTGWQGFVSVSWEGGMPKLGLTANYLAIFQCFISFLLFLLSLYLMGFFLYLEERESGRIMKSIKSYVKLREYLEWRGREDRSD